MTDSAPGPFAKRIVGVWSESPRDRGWYAAGWAVKSDPTLPVPDLWAVTDEGELPPKLWTATVTVANLHPAYVCLGPVEPARTRPEGGWFYEPVNYGLHLALKTMVKVGPGIGFERSTEARRSAVDLLVESGRLRFDGHAARLWPPPWQTDSPSIDAELTYDAVTQMVMADLLPTVTAADPEVWHRAATAVAPTG